MSVMTVCGTFGSNPQWCDERPARRYIPETTLRVDFYMSFGAKQLLREIVEHLPQDATSENAMDRRYVLAPSCRL